MDRKEIPERPFTGIISQDRRITRSVSRALDNQVVGSILNQIDTGIPRPVDFIPTDYLNRCTEVIFGRTSSGGNDSVVRVTDEIIIGPNELSLSFSRKLERACNMSHEEGAAAVPAGTDQQDNAMAQIMSMIAHQNRLMNDYMTELRQIRGEVESLNHRVVEVENKSTDPRLDDLGFSSTPGDATSCRRENVERVETNTNRDQTPPGRHSTSEGHRNQDQAGNRDNLGISYSHRELNNRKPVDLDRWHVKFDGIGRDMTVESFLFRIEKLRQQYNLTHDQLFSDFHCLVSGSAAKWYWQILEDHADQVNFDYFALKRELLNHFKSADSDYEIIREIMDRKQQPGEGFEDFYTEIHNLTFRLQKRIPEKELVQIVRGNLKSNIASLIFSSTVETIKELKRECKRAEKLVKDSRQRPKPVSELNVFDPKVEEEDILNIEAMSIRERQRGYMSGSNSSNPKTVTRSYDLQQRPSTSNSYDLQHKSTTSNSFQQPAGKDVGAGFCLSPFHMNLCFTCGMPGDFYRKNAQNLKQENFCKSTFHDMKCFSCGKSDSFCEYVPKNAQVAELTGNCCQNPKIPEPQQQ